MLTDDAEEALLQARDPGLPQPMLVDQRDLTEARSLTLMDNALKHSLRGAQIDFVGVLLLLIDRVFEILNSLVEQHDLRVDLFKDQLHLICVVSAPDHGVLNLSEVEIHNRPIYVRAELMEDDGLLPVQPNEAILFGRHSRYLLGVRFVQEPLAELLHQRLGYAIRFLALADHINYAHAFPEFA